ncbi:rhodanese-like domain-containing protein [Inhella gelatinilytica]|uniref:Rhodanese-like domain-containing protein n=1 Tax=Inhella gelatinilytica TaxID=2795030 RepID=A0A931IX54_9BURK|nr:rhodanese-like domain-containing protein [Inhella gelatinilytica]MBH9553181.1 rhodanese-like domain-containing protein [Inhella gelatinilytica]
MDFLSQNWHLVALAVGAGLALMWPSLSGKTAGVSASEAVRLMNREKAVLVDVCEPAEYAAGHAAGARSLPLGQIEAGAKALPSNKSLPIVLLCASGMRAGRAARQLQKLGHEKVVVLAGGMNAWREANLPVEKGGA